MNELRPGLWTWTAEHPSWTPEEGGPEGWERIVRSYVLDARDSLVLFDPLVEPARVEEMADGRPVVVILTCHWHRRSAHELFDALDATVHAPAASLSDLGFEGLRYELGDDLPGDVEPQVGGYPNEATLWLRGQAALVTGDVFLGGERGFRVQPDSWLAEGLSHESLREQLRPLLELPVELLLPTHGDPVTADARAVLARALET
ncbi:MAG TPA: MBL fold metallo-hydrolase [Gaiellaceae bacterium]|nr:MBL fold metallo-hydrolase [Gaiellaceae bacterium]